MEGKSSVEVENGKMEGKSCLGWRARKLYSLKARSGTVGEPKCESTPEELLTGMELLTASRVAWLILSRSNTFAVDATFGWVIHLHSKMIVLAVHSDEIKNSSP